MDSGRLGPRTSPELHIVNKVRRENGETEESAKEKLVERYHTALGGVYEINSDFVTSDDVLPSFVDWLTTEVSSRTEG